MDNSDRLGWLERASFAVHGTRQMHLLHIVQFSKLEYLNYEASQFRKEWQRKNAAGPSRRRRRGGRVAGQRSAGMSGRVVVWNRDGRGWRGGGWGTSPEVINGTRCFGLFERASLGGERGGSVSAGVSYSCTIVFFFLLLLACGRVDERRAWGTRSGVVPGPEGDVVLLPCAQQPFARWGNGLVRWFNLSSM